MKTYNLNKALYESIMNDVAKIVKKKLNTQNLFESFSDYSVTDFTRIYVAGDLDVLWTKEFDDSDNKRRTINDFAEFIDRIESISKNPSEAKEFFNALLTTLKGTMKEFEYNLYRGKK